MFDLKLLCLRGNVLVWASVTKHYRLGDVNSGQFHLTDVLTELALCWGPRAWCPWHHGALHHGVPDPGLAVDVARSPAELPVVGVSQPMLGLCFLHGPSSQLLSQCLRQVVCRDDV